MSLGPSGALLGEAQPQGCLGHSLGSLPLAFGARFVLTESRAQECSTQLAWAVPTSRAGRREPPPLSFHTVGRGRVVGGGGQKVDALDMPRTAAEGPGWVSAGGGVLLILRQLCLSLSSVLLSMGGGEEQEPKLPLPHGAASYPDAAGSTCAPVLQGTILWGLAWAALCPPKALWESPPSYQ